MIILMFLFGMIFGYTTAHNLYKMLFWLIIMGCILFLLLSIEFSVTGNVDTSVLALQEEVFDWNTFLSVFYGVGGFFLGAWLKTKSLEEKKS